MSYDVDIGDEWFNYTSNVGALFYDHMPAERSRGGLHELNGLTGAQAAKVIGAAFNRLDTTRLNLWREGADGETAFRTKYDAENGWGSAIGAIVFLGRIMAACVQNPRKKVKVSS